MRKLIEDLAKQAYEEVIKNTPSFLVTKELYAQKFAELLVRRCMSVIKQNEHANMSISNFSDEKKQGIQLGLEFAIADIAEYFGVEHD